MTNDKRAAQAKDLNQKHSIELGENSWDFDKEKRTNETALLA